MLFMCISTTVNEISFGFVTWLDLAIPRFTEKTRIPRAQ